jgi:hypothetical protein
MSPKKNKVAFLFLWVFTFFILLHDKIIFSWGTNARNDPFPMYTSRDPWEFLSYRERKLIEGFADEKGSPERVSISFSPFGQNANKARSLSATYKRIPGTSPTDGSPAQCDVAGPGPCTQITFPATSCFNDIEIGDIDGRWNLLGLIAGAIPTGQSFPPVLAAAAQAICPNLAPGQITSKDIDFQPTVPMAGSNIDPKTFGIASVPLKYRKRGIRWDLEAQICGDFGLQFQGGIVEISQVLNCSIVNLTGSLGDATSQCGNCPVPSAQTIDCNLFDQLPEISKQINYDICDFTKVGVEDLYFSLYWRHLHNVNFYRDLSWSRLLVIPFFRVGGSVASGKAKDPSKAFSVPFGNNGHNSADVNAGINFDFVETVEIGAEAAVSHFFARDVCGFHLPNNEAQSGIFPFATTVRYQPGDTFYVAAKLAAYHFLDRLSFWLQWVFVHHREDHIGLINCDPAFLTPKCPNTVWRVQLANIAFNYDISPSISMGLLWQQPLHVRNAYNSTTILFNVNFIF